MALRIVVFYGSVRTERQGIRVARFVVNECRARGHEVTLIDPLEHPLPLLDKMYKEYPKGGAPETLQRLADLIVPADGIIVVSGEYNHSIPPALSNLLDHFLEEYFWKPSAIVCYSAGYFGGVRAAMQLRAMLAELGCRPSRRSSRCRGCRTPSTRTARPGTRRPTSGRRSSSTTRVVRPCAPRRAENRPRDRSECEAQDLVGKAPSSTPARPEQSDPRERGIVGQTAVPPGTPDAGGGVRARHRGRGVAAAWRRARFFTGLLDPELGRDGRWALQRLIHDAVALREL